MSRIDPAGGTPVPIDTTPTETGAAPASSRTKGPQPLAPTARNEVRAYDGPPARSSSKPDSAGTAPPSAGPSFSAGELAATGGRLRQPSSSEVPAEVYAGIRSHLTRSLGDWAVTGGDVKAVHTALGTLPPGAYRAALERMERDGLLGEYVKAQAPDTRQAFLEQAESKGMLQRNKGEAPAGPLGYPAHPDFFRNDAKLPESMRSAVNAYAIDAGAAFYKAHSDYLDRYADAVNGAKSLQELHALGRPREAYLKQSALGIDGKDPARKEYAAEWRRGIGQPESLNRTYQTINARQRELTGERPGGSIRSHAKVALTHEGLKLGTEAHVDTRGKVGLKGEAGIAVSGGPLGIEATRDTAGGVKVETKLNLGFAELSHASDGEVKLSLGVGRSAQAFVALNRKTAEFGGGVSAEVGSEGRKAEAEVGFSMKGLSPTRVHEAFDKHHRGVFDSPPELTAGMAWDSLPEPQRASYSREGWNRDTWTGALKR